MGCSINPDYQYARMPYCNLLPVSTAFALCAETYGNLVYGEKSAAIYLAVWKFMIIFVPKFNFNYLL